MMSSTRAQIGVIAFAGLIGAAAARWFDEPQASGVTLRIALVLGAVWFAWPSMGAVPRRSWLLTLLTVAVILWRPRSAWVVLPALVWATRRRV